MSDTRMAEAAELVDTIYGLNETIKEHESVIAILKQDVERRTDRLRLLVEGTGLTEVAGSLARAKFGLKSVPKVIDWQQVYAYVLETHAFDLLHKRLGVKAWEERINAGAYVPGVECIVIPDVNIRGKR